MKKNTIKRIVDVCMTVVLLCLMAYQVCGEVLHEFGGILMTVLLIVHHILNIKWYAALFKGKYNAYRIVQTIVNMLLLGSIALTALCGMAMSAHAVPFLYGMLPITFARQFHLAMSFWSFVLMGLHLGLHVPAMTAGIKWGGKVKTAAACLCSIVAGVGLWLFVKNGIPGYIFFRTPFAFFDYDKPAVLVFAENLAILVAFAFLGACLTFLTRAAGKGSSKKILRLVLLALIIAAMLLLLASCGQGAAPANNSEPSVQGPPKGQDPAVGVFDLESKTVLLNSGYRMPILGLGTYSLDDNWGRSRIVIVGNSGKMTIRDRPQLS